jgi:pyruvyltransferase
MKHKSAVYVKSLFYCKKAIIAFFTFCTFPFCHGKAGEKQPLALYYWQAKKFENFGDYLSVKIVERMIQSPVEIYKKNPKNPRKKLLALGSILFFAEEGDVLWGTGMNAKFYDKKDFCFTNLDVRAVRGPLTRQFLIDNFHINVPEIYGDPALLIPHLFPEFKPNEHPRFSHVILPHYSDMHLFPKEEYPNVIYPTEPWDVVIEKILDSHFVISSSLHGIIVAEAFGIPAKYVRLSQSEPEFKYRDYYLGTGRSSCKFATSIDEALEQGGEPPFTCDLQRLYDAFPFDYFHP